MSSVTADGSDSVVLKLTGPNSFLLSELALISVHAPGKPDIGTGPFELVSRGEQQTLLKAFPSYYRGHPASTKSKSTATRRAQAWSALLRGDVDMLQEVSLGAEDFVQATSTVHTYLCPTHYYLPLVFNVRNPILKHVQVRRAINGASIRQVLVQDGLSTAGARRTTARQHMGGG